MVIGVGAHATRRLKTSLGDLIAPEDGSPGLKVGTILHPSPASPAANRDWAGTATRQMQSLGLLPG